MIMLRSPAGRWIMHATEKVKIGLSKPTKTRLTRGTLSQMVRGIPGREQTNARTRAEATELYEESAVHGQRVNSRSRSRSNPGLTQSLRLV